MTNRFVFCQSNCINRTCKHNFNMEGYNAQVVEVMRALETQPETVQLSLNPSLRKGCAGYFPSEVD